MQKPVFIGTFLLALAGASAITLVTTKTDAAAYENIGGFLQTPYRLPNPSVGSSVLPPLGPADGQVCIGRPNNPAAERTRNFNLTDAATGISVEGGGADAPTRCPPRKIVGTAPHHPAAFRINRIVNV